MNIRSSKILVSLFFLLFVLNSCADQVGKAKTKQKKVFKHDTPLIKKDVKKDFIEECSIEVFDYAGSKISSANLYSWFSVYSLPRFP